MILALSRVLHYHEVGLMLKVGGSRTAGADMWAPNGGSRVGAENKVGAEVGADISRWFSDCKTPNLFSNGRGLDISRASSPFFFTARRTYQ